jgi:hypothetical protein
MPGQELPQGLGRLFSDGGAGRILDVDLPPGRLVVPEDSEPGTAPAYWLSEEPAGPALWVRLHQAHPRSGLWPVFATAHRRYSGRPWVAGEVRPKPVARIDVLDASAVLEGFWRAKISGEHHFLEVVGDDPREMAGSIKLDPRTRFPELEPFSRRWPGLAPAGDGAQEPDEFSDQYVLTTDDGTSPILLVPAARSADVVTAVGWQGPCNYTNDIPLLSSVLRSWEERFGARVIQVGFDTLLLAVAAPPVTAGHAEQVAAEHFAFCPDIVVGDRTSTIRQYTAQMLQGQSDWWFWWD